MIPAIYSGPLLPSLIISIDSSFSSPS